MANVILLFRFIEDSIIIRLLDCPATSIANSHPFTITEDLIVKVFEDALAQWKHIWLLHECTLKQGHTLPVPLIGKLVPCHQVIRH